MKERFEFKKSEQKEEIKIEIREASPEYLEDYTDLNQVTYQDAFTDESIGLTAECFSKEVFNSDDFQEYLESKLIEKENQKTWLAFHEGKLVGSITCVLRNDGKAEIGGFYVYPDFQGKGIGDELYKTALKFSGNRDLVLDVYVHNNKAIEIYKKKGWELDESRGNKGYFYRDSNDWPEWSDDTRVKCMYMKLDRNKKNNLN